LLAALSSVHVAHAEGDDVWPFYLRGTIAGAAMVSETQTGRMGYSIGPIGDLQLGYALQRWFDLRASAILATFPGMTKTPGMLLAPTLGVVGSIPLDGIRPYLQLDVGPGFTGSFIRFFFRASIGVEFRATQMFTAGPVIGYGHLVQRNGRGYSSDARFFWLGLSVSLRPASVKKTEPPAPQIVRKIERRTITTVVPPPPYDPPPPAAPSPELEVLLDEALPTQRVELLAPVLFAFDSDELQPIGVAMLHEVARELERRPDIKLLEVQGYADARGDADHNMELSERRGQHVIDWLVAHGVRRDRLQLAPRGATQFVQPGTDETDHEQNRRVVFRVLNPGDR
jgi:outer membrane protein OmpA-like peptidoglycan-associated protein